MRGKQANFERRKRKRKRKRSKKKMNKEKKERTAAAAVNARERKMKAKISQSAQTSFSSVKRPARRLRRFLRYQASPFGMPSGHFKN